MRTRHAIIFARPPRLGRVKRRLAADIGDVAATRIYRVLSSRLVRRLGRDPRWRSRLFVASGEGRWPAGPARQAQAEGDLGRRMDRALRSLPPGPVVLVGSDIPDLEPCHLVGAFRALGRRDVVFGPAGDGGFWLVGLRHRRVAPDLFRSVRWSSAHALADTIANLGGRWSHELIDELNDVDNGADLVRSGLR